MMSPANLPGFGEDEEPGPVVRDRRRLDPDTGRVRTGADDSAAVGSATTGTPAAAEPAESSAGSSSGESAATEVGAAQAQAAEHLADLQRLQAEYVNYRKRVERDRDVARDSATAAVLEALLPVLDDIQLAKDHGDLNEGPFASIAEKLQGTVQRLGLESYGVVHEVFDPTLHEALTQGSAADLPADATTTTVVAVLQPGYRIGERIIRPARVAVADPT